MFVGTVGLVTKSLLLQCNSKLCSKSTDVLRAKHEMFVLPQVQDLLTRLTRVDPNVTLPNRVKFKRPREITLMSDEQLEQARREAMERALAYCQMPPVLPAREEDEMLLSDDKRIDGFSKSNSTYVFVDTTLGISERERNVVVRKPNGQLVVADAETKDRMMSIYYPRIGRRVKPASLLYGTHLQNLLDKQNYKQILDTACTQFEPDNSHYIQVTHQVYQHCDAMKSYDKLLSTRHYGPMVFYFILQKHIKHLLKHFILHNRITECLDTVSLYNLVWETTPTGEVPGHTSPVREQVSYLISFMKGEGMDSAELEEELKQYVAKQEALKSQSAANELESELSSDSDSDSSSSSDSESDGEDNPEKNS